MRKTLLVVDESSAARAMTSLVLRGAGYDVRGATNGEEVIAHLAGEQIDLVVSEVHMPGMGGIALVQRMKAIAPLSAIPVIILTTAAGMGEKEQGRAVGVARWIIKPYRPEFLVDAVSQLLCD